MDKKTFIDIAIDFADFFTLAEKLEIGNRTIKATLKTIGSLDIPFCDVEERVITEEFNRLLEKYTKP